MGWVEHMQDIRSFEKLNAIGRVFFGTALHALVEEVLPGRFGGQPRRSPIGATTQRATDNPSKPFRLLI